jgi:hypothetical protein
MGVNNLFKAKKQLNEVAPPGERLAYINEDEANLLKSMGGLGTRENNPARIPSFIGASHSNHHGGGLSPSSSPGAADAGGTGPGDGNGFASQPYSGDPNDYGNSYGPSGNPTGTPDGGEEDKPKSILDSIFGFFSDLAPTPEEQFSQDWDKLHGWQKRKALSQLGITEDQLTGDVMSAFNDYNNMSLSEIQDAISGLSLNSFNPFQSGTLGMAYSMFDAMNPFTNTQYNLQDMNNWSMEPSDIMGPVLGTYTGNVASLNSAQLADLANQQMGGLTNTQLGQALAGMVNDVETQNATRGPDYPTVNNMNDQNVELTDSAKQIADLISRGFSEAMAERIVSSGKYFASYDE